MKILHTADWHLGKIINEFSMLEDQKYILNELKTIICENHVEVLVVAGDIYDRSVPPASAVALFNQFLSDLINELKVKVLLIPGNHDSNTRLSFGSSLLRANGLHIAGSGDSLYDKVALDEQTDAYLFPYLDPIEVRHRLADETINSHETAIQAIIQGIDFNQEKLNIGVFHGYVYHGKDILEESDSERPLAVGGTDAINASVFHPFDYVYLGHLHGRQQVVPNHIIYSGSPLKYSFSEVNQVKGVFITDTTKQEEALSFHELKPIRNMRIIHGELAELITMEDANCLDYVKVELTDVADIINPMEKIRTKYPNAMALVRVNEQFNNNLENLNRDYQAKSPLEQFSDFYQFINERQLNEDEQIIIENVMNDTFKREE